MTTHDEFASWDGAYVLGALSPTERRAYEEHLRDCDQCIRSLSELAGLPGILSRVPAEEAFALVESAGSGIPSPEPSPEILPALLGEVRKRRSRRRWWAAGSLAAAAAVIVAVSAFVLPSVLAPAPSQQAGVSKVMTQVEPSALSAEMKLAPMPWGTRIDTTCRYATWEGAESGRAWTYAMVVTDRSGKQTQISTWSAKAGSTVEPTATTSVPLDQIATIDIRSAVDGMVLLRSSFG
ncbi:anti-sigma factor family protein [Leifsonia sp. NPDC058248]|uniref:anti-sigma factor family protein n=1 Tax=Leifsonia sp. NPDC058248 TaxID=3346402 RepID=UPI0036D9AA68